MAGTSAVRRVSVCSTGLCEGLDVGVVRLRVPGEKRERDLRWKTNSLGTIISSILRHSMEG